VNVSAYVCSDGPGVILITKGLLFARELLRSAPLFSVLAGSRCCCDLRMEPSVVTPHIELSLLVAMRGGSGRSHISESDERGDGLFTRLCSAGVRRTTTWLRVVPRRVFGLH
jgi:hypothetical protein